MKAIILVNGLESFVDDGDFDWLSQFKWSARKGRKTYYAQRTEYSEGKCRTVHMAREITACPKGLCVDHVDGNGLNNQRSNLRIVTLQQNNSNFGMYVNNTSGFRGVSYRKYQGNGARRFPLSGISSNLGYFDTPEDASAVFEEACAKYRGDFARKQEFMHANYLQ